MLRRFWQWYFWNTPPILYDYGRRSRFRSWLWWHTHPRWLREIRTALMTQHAMEEAARSGALRRALRRGAGDAAHE